MTGREFHRDGMGRREREEEGKEVVGGRGEMEGGKGRGKVGRTQGKLLSHEPVAPSKLSGE